ncbi:MAG: hypothetical protein ACK5LJ_06560 [Paracoccus sp. (in: a-proteobacteria)]
MLKILVVIVVFGLLALVGFAYFGDMAPRQQEMRQPVALDTGMAPAAAPPASGASAAEQAPEAEDSAAEDAGTAANSGAGAGEGEGTESNGLD